MKILSPLALCLATALSVGCANTLKNGERTPEVSYPSSWKKSDMAGDLAPFDWKAFNDPYLNNWLHQVMASNNDVAIALLRVYQARLDAERVGIFNAPGLKGSLSVDGKNQLNNSFGWTESSSASLTTNYAVDLWGKISRQRDALSGQFIPAKRICAPHA